VPSAYGQRLRRAAADEVALQLGETMRLARARARARLARIGVKPAKNSGLRVRALLG
jgi:hypothetical protein